MLTAFQLDDQVFRLVRFDQKPTTNGRVVLVAYWITRCLDCGGTFVQHRRVFNFSPIRNTSRRCSDCRTGKPINYPGKDRNTTGNLTADDPLIEMPFPRDYTVTEAGQDDLRPATTPQPSTPPSPPPRPATKVRLFTDR